MRPTLPPWKMHRPGAFFAAQSNFWTKMRVFGDFWKFPLPRELNPRLPYLSKGRDRLYQAPIAQFSNAPLATGGEIRRDLGKNARDVSICGVSPNIVLHW